MKKYIRFFSLSMVISVVLMTSIPNIAGELSKLTTSLQFSDDWILGNALGNPGFVGHGNFTNKEFDEILLVSRIPEETDAMTLSYYNGVNLTVEGSKDKDFSSVYQELIADFDGDGDDEVLVSEDWTTEIGEHIGAVHNLYDYTDFRFELNTTYYHANPAIILDKGLTIDLDENNDSELILATWDSENNTELVRVYNYYNETFVQITNISYQLLETNIYYRSILYLGYGDFNGDSQEELIVFSKFTYNYAPSTFFYTFEIYSYDKDLELLTHEFSGQINIFESELSVLHLDIDQDEKDELFLYYDRVADPAYFVYELSPIEVKLEFQGLRPQSEYSSTGYYVIDVISHDVNFDGNDEIIFVESKIDFGDEFKGRVEIYQYSSNTIESICLENFLRAPTDVFIADINTNPSCEIVTVFNYYTDEFLAKGGIEIWSIINDESNSIPIFTNMIDYLLIINGPILLIIIIRIKLKLNQNNYKNKSYKPEA